MTAGLDGLDGDQIAAAQVFDPCTDLDHFSAQLVTENDRIVDACQRVGVASRGDRAIVVLVQVAATDSVVEHAKLDLARSRRGIGHVLEPQVLATVVDRCTHIASTPLGFRRATLCRSASGRQQRRVA
jgi:hypothetical protein